MSGSEWQAVAVAVEGSSRKFQSTYRQAVAGCSGGSQTSSSGRQQQQFPVHQFLQAVAVAGCSGGRQ